MRDSIHKLNTDLGRRIVINPQIPGTPAVHPSVAPEEAASTRARVFKAACKFNRRTRAGVGQESAPPPMTGTRFSKMPKFRQKKSDQNGPRICQDFRQNSQPKTRPCYPPHTMPPGKTATHSIPNPSCALC